MSGAPASPFPADALAANQAGKLTDSQRQLYAANDRSFRKTELYLAIGTAIVAALLLTSTGPAPNAAFRPLVGGILIVVAVVLVIRATISSDALSSDLSNGSVASVEGAVAKRAVHSDSANSSSTQHYLEVAGKELQVGPRFYDATPDAGYVKVYYLPKSKTVVNLELLPDRPLPAGAADNPMAVVQDAFKAMKSGDTTGRAEAMAEMAVMSKSLHEGVVAAAVQPPADQLDQRPLAQAIVGSRRAGPIGVSFAADGTMTTDLPGGHGQPGRWSVDASGELHADFAGRDLAGQAWVSGDTLTIKEGAEGRQFKRVGG